ncbi:hypothetical protein [Micromonospora fulviviridis]|uniref:Uncharacterized protein n=1 Tax=Micromonospora fulviviridis TaxID=47860 RepID=A0ABV2VK02_9ACTN
MSRSRRRCRAARAETSTLHERPARAALDWLAARFPLDPAIADPVRALLSA